MGRSREMSVEDLYRVGEDRKAELFDGRLVVMTPGGGLHGYACGLIYASLLDHARRTKRGSVLKATILGIVTREGGIEWRLRYLFATPARLR